tara:strand:+ start:59 stop:385 length:327 start_codon:yes stop_codon:yes gene_type:complete
MSDQITKKIHSFLKSELSLIIPLEAIDIKTGWIFTKQKSDKSIDFQANYIEQSIQYKSKDEMMLRGLDYIFYTDVIEKMSDFHDLKWKFVVLVGDGVSVYRGNINSFV